MAIFCGQVNFGCSVCLYLKFEPVEAGAGSMERLTVQQRAAVGKMSDDRLRLKLVQAGYLTEDVGRLDRQGLLQTYAACLADEEDEKRARAAVAEAEGADVFAEAAAAVFGEPHPYLMAEQEVIEVENVQQFAGDDHAAGCGR